MTTDDEDRIMSDTVEAITDALHGRSFGHAFAAMGMVMTALLAQVSQDERPDILTSWLGSLSRAVRLADDKPSRTTRH